ncbi:hypothetical protein BHE74_00011094 [Ensete ventricosum]|uniref:Uncharacterized protein n=1 Tax=Ensete ventricosum TaxID=4639 RepID=A0A445MKD8_ENSVE|nr:hypothetical protein BHE74_00011094 [Ensete ventricosum]RZR74668.1 hypothetical protein BHM03_00041185 [Ensete ventricosum]
MGGLYRANFRSLPPSTGYRFRPPHPTMGRFQPGRGDGRRSKRKREKKRENLIRCHPLTARRRLDYRRRLQSKNLRMAPRMRTS